MQTQIADRYKQDPQIDDAETILRKCVHCGFCLATCPTYNIIGDELDSPRGRIYLIKQVLEGETPTNKTQLHLDRCLTCRNCETTCPSGVEYSRLVDIGRRVVEEEVGRSFSQRVFRWLLLQILPYKNRIGPIIKMGQWVRPLLPESVRQSIPVRTTTRPLHAGLTATRKMLVLDGFVQPSMSPVTNAACTRVLQRLGTSLEAIPRAGCCGAINHHLNDQETALDQMRNNIDVWWPEIEKGAEAIVMTASGCGSVVKEYGHLLKDDLVYGAKAKVISEKCLDIAEILVKEDLSSLQIDGSQTGPIAYHPPCTLLHGQKLPGLVEGILDQLGVELTSVPDAHTCCGSAGTYSLFQKKLPTELKTTKIENLTSGNPSLVATSNIGCQLHLQSATSLPVKHWIEVLDDMMEAT